MGGCNRRHAQLGQGGWSRCVVPCAGIGLALRPFAACHALRGRDTLAPSGLALAQALGAYIDMHVCAPSALHANAFPQTHALPGHGWTPSCMCMHAPQLFLTQMLSSNS